MGQHRSPWTPVELSAPGGAPVPVPAHPRQPPSPPTSVPQVSSMPAPWGHSCLPHLHPRDTCPIWHQRVGDEQTRAPGRDSHQPCGSWGLTLKRLHRHRQRRSPLKLGSSGSHGSACLSLAGTSPGLCTSTTLAQHLHASFFIHIFLGVGGRGAEMASEEHRRCRVCHGPRVYAQCKGVNLQM